MGVKHVELKMNTVNWNEMTRLISSGDSSSNTAFAHSNRLHVCPASLSNCHIGAHFSSCNSSNGRTYNVKKKKKRSTEPDCKSQIQKFLNPCKAYSSNNKDIRRRIKELETKVCIFEKLYYNALHTWVKDAKERSKASSKNDNKITTAYENQKEKKKVKIVDEPKEVRILDMDENSSNKESTLNLSKNQQSNNPTDNIKKRSAKNKCIMNQESEYLGTLNPVISEDGVFSSDSNISLTADNTGRYYFVTSTTGYVKNFNEDVENQSIPYKPAADVAKLSKKNLVYLFNQEILPRCVDPFHNCGGYKTNLKFHKETYPLMKDVIDKSTSTDNVPIDKPVTIKERCHCMKEGTSPMPTFPADIILNTKSETFETSSTQIHENNDVSMFENLDNTWDLNDVCFSTYPINCSSTSFSESSNNCIKIITLKKQNDIS